MEEGKSGIIFTRLSPMAGLLGVGLATLLCMAPSLFNAWVNWDDQEYVLNNPLIQSLSFEQIGVIFSTLEVQGNYHPLTLISLAVDYQFSGTDPFLYHFTNLVFHLLNTGLVFGFLYLLTGRLFVAIIAALLFGIHPMHVESVAWISERKDVLYTCFFLGGLIFYLFYLKRESKKYMWLGLCLLSFVLSLLSKGMAVTFPLILLLIDYYENRSDYLRLVLEKAPFFVLSLGFGILVLIAQRAGKAFINVQDLALLDSLVISGYGLSLYLLKALIPFQLSAFHPYPIEPDATLPWYVYLSAVCAAMIWVVSWRKILRNRSIGFGVGFFILSLLPVLQVLPVGNTVISERYTYIAYIGLFVIAGLIGNQILTGEHAVARKYQVGLRLLMGGFVLMLMLITFTRVQVWKNGETLWTDVIEKYPDDYFAYGCRGLYWVENNDFKKAMADFNNCLARNPDFTEGYINRGMLYAQAGDYEQAVTNYDQAILLDSMNYLSYLNRGSILRIAQNYQQALADLNRSIQLNPNVPMAYHNRGVVFKTLKRYDLAIQNYSEALRLEPGDPFVLYSRGLVYYLQGNPTSALPDFNLSISLKPDYAEAYYYRSLSYRDLGRKAEALQNALQARKLQLPVADIYIQQLKEE